MEYSLNSISSLDLSRVDDDQSRHSLQTYPSARMAKRNADPNIESRPSISDAESTSSRHASPAQSSALELNSSSAIAECTCIDIATGTPIGPPCRLCRTASYNTLQEDQEWKTRKRAQLKAVTSNISAVFTSWSKACRWTRKRKHQPSSDDGQNSQVLHSKKDSLVSWPDSECTYVHDAEAVDGKVVDGQSLEHKSSVTSSRSGKLASRSISSKGFLRIPDTEEERAARKEEKRRRRVESLRNETYPYEYWHDERVVIDWRIVWAMSAIC